MIAGPPIRFDLAAPLFTNKESVMSDVKPVIEVHPATRSTQSSPPGRKPFDSFSIPISPKIHELRARYEALQATEKDRMGKLSKP